MFLFHSKTSYEEQGVLKGFTDWHSHILPGVDDGVKTIDEALDILTLYQQLGVRNIWLTPHIMEDVPNTTAHLLDCFAQLKEAYKGSINLNLAAEYMLDSLFAERLLANDILTLGSEKRHVLVETSYFDAPVGFDATLKRIMAQGYVPVLAHPERYLYMNEKDYRRYIDMGVILQMNLFSTTGMYGETARKKASMLLKMSKSPSTPHFDLPTTGSQHTHTTSCAISLLGTDVHSIKQATKGITSKEMNSNIASLVLELV